MLYIQLQKNIWQVGQNALERQVTKPENGDRFRLPVLVMGRSRTSRSKSWFFVANEQSRIFRRRQGWDRKSRLF